MSGKFTSHGVEFHAPEVPQALPVTEWHLHSWRPQNGTACAGDCCPDVGPLGYVLDEGRFQAALTATDGGATLV